MNGKGPYIFKADHMHMHGPAEHKINGVQHGLEMHIVNVLCDGPDWQNFKETLAVVSIIFKEDKYSHPFVEKLRVEDKGHIESINFEELFNIKEDEPETKKNLPFFHYKGSLTNPPCSDIVNWIIYKEVLPISDKHLKTRLKSWHNHLGGHYNNRECQAINGRRIVRNFQQ